MKKDMIWLERLLKKEFSPTVRFFVKHTSWIVLFGVIFLAIAYYNILSIRTTLEGGYFSSPFWTTLSEFTWFLMGGAIYLVFGLAKKLFKKKKSKR